VSERLPTCGALTAAAPPPIGKCISHRISHVRPSKWCITRSLPPRAKIGSWTDTCDRNQSSIDSSSGIRHQHTLLITTTLSRRPGQMQTFRKVLPRSASWQHQPRLTHISNVFGSLGLGPSYRGDAREPQPSTGQVSAQRQQISTVWVLGHALTEPTKSHLSSGKDFSMGTGNRDPRVDGGALPRKEKKKTAREPGLPSAPSPPTILGSMRNRQIAETYPTRPSRRQNRMDQ
jgi:hypothetical protein